MNTFNLFFKCEIIAGYTAQYLPVSQRYVDKWDFFRWHWGTSEGCTAGSFWNRCTFAESPLWKSKGRGGNVHSDRSFQALLQGQILTKLLGPVQFLTFLHKTFKSGMSTESHNKGCNPYQISRTPPPKARGNTFPYLEKACDSTHTQREGHSAHSLGTSESLPESWVGLGPK